MRGLAKRLGNSAASFGVVVRNSNLRRLELAWTASIFGHFAYLIALSVYAYDVGGKQAVGLVFLLRLVPAALVSPFAGLLGDRYRREHVLLATNCGRVVLVGAAAVLVLLGAPPAVVYFLAVMDGIVSTPTRSAQAALTPSLARSPGELTAANAVASGVESLALFGGPALGALVLAVTSPGVVFSMTALMFVAAVVFVALIKVDRVERPRREVEASTIASEALAGFTTIGRHPSLRVMMVLLTAQTGVAGALQVFIVVSAIELLALGDAGVGYLNSAIGIGALVGAIVALSLTGARRLSPVFMLGVVLMGMPLIAVGVAPELAVALIVLGVFGAGSALVDVAGLTIVQRSVPDDVLARVFGVIQMLWYGSLGIGAFVAPQLIAWLGVETALIAVGAFLPVLVAIFGVKVARIDAAAEAPRNEELRILAAVPIFAPLPGGSLEHLASRLVPLRFEPGTVIVREGDAGDRFYIVAEGEIEVSQDGRRLSELASGDYFGEISLIRDVPRTATVTARTHVVVYALDRDDFLAAVTGHPTSAEAAENVVSARLAGPASSGARSPTA